MHALTPSSGLQLELRRTRTLLRWSSLTALAGGLPWVVPAMYVVGTVVGPITGAVVFPWLGSMAVIGSVLWAHVQAGPTSVRRPQVEWALALAPAWPVSLALSRSRSLAQTERRLGVVAVLWLSLQMALAYGLAALI